MYITKVVLENVRCFEKLEIDFEQRGSSILFLGDNGDGKSTILKSIAMGLCDESSAAALFRELPGEFVRREKGQDEVPAGNFGFIEVDLANRSGTIYRIKTTITSLKKFERVHQELFKFDDSGALEPLKQDEFPWEQIFVSGYGPGVRIQATSDFQHYLPVDAVYSLFSYLSQLQNPELVIRRLISVARGKTESSEEAEAQEDKVLLIIKSLMADLLDLESPDNFNLTSTGIKVEGHWGTAELSELGDGYQAVINLVLDLLSWWFLRENGESEWNLESLRGIVIIDEIEQHLHPKWQRRIFPRLRGKFPNIQFIVATHSPLVASANKDVDVYLLGRGKYKILHPFGWLAEDVYEVMGLEKSRSKEFTEEVIERYQVLDRKNNFEKLETQEKAELEELKKQFSSLPESDPISLLIEIENATNELKKDIEGEGS